MIEDVEAAIRDYLPRVCHMSLATCCGNAPWVSEVHFAYDEDLNLYFRSLRSRRHSKEIAANPRVAGNIVAQHALGEKPRGVYFEGTAELLDAVDEAHPAFLAIHARFGKDTSILEDARREDGHAFYRIAVETYSLFDGRESTPGRKYELPWRAA